MALTDRQLVQWFIDRHRQSEQHPDEQATNSHARGRGVSFSRGDHYRKKNNGTAYRTFLGVQGLPTRLYGLRRDRHSASMLTAPKDSRGLQLALECGYTQFNAGYGWVDIAIVLRQRRFA